MLKVDVCVMYAELAVTTISPSCAGAFAIPKSWSPAPSGSAIDGIGHRGPQQRCGRGAGPYGGERGGIAARGRGASGLRRRHARYFGLFRGDRTAWGRLTRLLSLGKLRAQKGDCILGLADLVDFIEGLNLIVMAPPRIDARGLAETAGTVAASSRRKIHPASPPACCIAAMMRAAARGLRKSPAMPPFR